MHDKRYNSEVTNVHKNISDTRAHDVVQSYKYNACLALLRIWSQYLNFVGAWGSVVVKALRY
jgi:hypothetical protein